MSQLTGSSKPKQSETKHQGKGHEPWPLQRKTQMNRAQSPDIACDVTVPLDPPRQYTMKDIQGQNAEAQGRLGQETGSQVKRETSDNLDAPHVLGCRGESSQQRGRASLQDSSKSLTEAAFLFFKKKKNVDHFGKPWMRGLKGGALLLSVMRLESRPPDSLARCVAPTPREESEHTGVASSGQKGHQELRVSPDIAVGCRASACAKALGD